MKKKDSPKSTRHTKGSTMKSSAALRKTAENYCPEHIISLISKNICEVGLAAFNEVSGEITIAQVLNYSALCESCLFSFLII